MTLLRAGRNTQLSIKTVMIGAEFYYLGDIPVRYELHYFTLTLDTFLNPENDNERKSQ
jgi:hypothetical protein